jgi:hypothetical protein
VRHFPAALFALSSLLGAANVFAGGSDVQVAVVSFVARSDIDYTLVVEPVTPSQTEQHPDPYIGHCHRFTVSGTYSRLAGFQLTQPPIVTRAAHLDALEFLRTSAASHAMIRFGWMGSGFLVGNPAEPCLVKSRALVIFTDEHGKAVISFYRAP